MKAVFLLPRIEPAGPLDDAVLFARALAEALEGMGHRADLLAPPSDRAGTLPLEELARRAEQARFPGVAARLAEEAALRKELVRRNREEAYDVVEVVWDGREGLLPAFPARLPYTVRLFAPPREGSAGGGEALEGFLERRLRRAAAGSFRGLSAGSSYLSSQAREKLGVSCLNWVILPGVARPSLPPRPEEEPGPFLYVAGKSREEALAPAEALRSLLERREDLSLRILGGDPRRPGPEALREELVRRGIPPERIRLFSDPDPAGLLEGSRGFLAASFQGGGLWALLSAMAAGLPAAVPALPWIYEYVRPEIDGLLFDPGDGEALARSLERLLEDPARAGEMGRQGAARAAARFSREETARTTLAFWKHALALRGREAPREGGLPLGPENWFEAWWLSGGEPGKTTLARDSRGEPLLGALSLEELGFLESLLSRAWWEAGGAWDAPEGELLAALARLLEEKARRAREQGDSPRERETGRLVLPPWEHPLFRKPGGRLFLEESWRIRSLDFFRAWLEREAGGAAEGILLEEVPRALLVLAAAERPSPALFEVLRKAYRESELRHALLAGDRSLRERGPWGEGFGKALDRLGLHAPLERPPVFGEVRGRRAGSPPGRAPAVTVLVPSFRHERFIRRTLESVLGQTYPEIRVLVVDDASPDGTVEAARSLEDPRLTVEANPENLGLGRSLLRALPRVETPYVALLNSDDLYHPERIAACVEALEGDSGADLAATELVFADGRDRLLTAENVPLVEVGPKIGDLVRWYEREIRGAAPPLDRTALEGLLRHNHLLTSSNVFCRTDYLRSKADLLEDLLYTVDWCLFLEASREGRLLFLDRPLLAYRLHENNTMWFDSGSRPGYVMEIHRLLSRFFRRMAASGRGREAARLLLEEAEKHGEVEGWFLFLAGLDLLPPSEELPPWLRERIQGIGPAKLLLREGRRAGLEGPKVGRILWEAEQYLPARIESVACRREKESLAGRLAWAEGGREQFRRWAEDEAAQRERIAGELRESLAKVGKLEEEKRALLERIASLEEETRRLGGELETLREEKARQEGALREKIRALQARLEEVEAALAAERREREAALAEKRRALEEARRFRARARDLRYRAFLEAALLRESHQWRVGEFLLDRMKLLGPWKTLVRVERNLRARLSRAAAAAGGGAGRVVLAADGAYPAPREFLLSLEARLLAGAGLPVEVLCRRKGRGLFAGKRRVVPGDLLLHKWDRRFFRGRNRAALDRVEAFPLPESEKGRLFSFARSALSSRAGCLLACGLGFGAWAARAASLLLEIPFGLSLSPWDLALLAGERELWSPLLEEAGLVALESSREEERLREILGRSLPSARVRGPLPLETLPAEGRAGGPFRVILLGSVVPARELPLLPRAARRARELGAPLELHFMGGPWEDPEGLEAWDFFVEEAWKQGLQETFLLRGDLTLEGVASLFAEADLIVEGRLEGAPEGRVFLAGAAASGLPALAARDEAVRDWVGKGDFSFYEPGDARALGELLAERAAGRGARADRPRPVERQGEERAAWIRAVEDLARSGRRR